MLSPTTLYSLELVSTCSMMGIIWLVQVLVYPSFLLIPPNQRAPFHRHHVNRISTIVLPLMVAELACGVWLTWLVWPNVGVDRAAAMACLATVWISTFSLQVPLHQRIAITGEERTIRLLISSNWIRTLAWTIKTALLML